MLPLYYLLLILFLWWANQVHWVNAANQSKRELKNSILCWLSEPNWRSPKVCSQDKRSPIVWLGARAGKAAHSPCQEQRSARLACFSWKSTCGKVSFLAPALEIGVTFPSEKHQNCLLQHTCLFLMSPQQAEWFCSPLVARSSVNSQWMLGHSRNGTSQHVFSELKSTNHNSDPNTPLQAVLVQNSSTTVAREWQIKRNTVWGLMKK